MTKGQDRSRPVDPSAPAQRSLWDTDAASDDSAASQTSPAESVSRVLSTRDAWDWWAPLPAGLTHREQLLWQIRRDMRARDEALDPDQVSFFTQRITSYQQAVRDLDK